MGTKRAGLHRRDASIPARTGARWRASWRDELTRCAMQLDVPMPGIDEALDQALAVPDGGPVVLADGADNAGGGAPGDSTFMLRRLVERGVERRRLGPLWDPVAVRIAFEAGDRRARCRCASAARSARCRATRWTCAGRRCKALRRELTMTGLAGTPTAMGDCALVAMPGRRGPVEQPAQPGHGHRHVHAARRRPGGEEDRRRRSPRSTSTRRSRRWRHARSTSTRPAR